MAIDVKIQKIDDVWIKIHTDVSIATEMNEFFSFYAPGYRYMPAFKSHVWDGKIRLFNMQTRKIYQGLLIEVLKFCKDRGYTFQADPNLRPTDTPENAATGFISSLDLPFSPYDYQVHAFQEILEKQRKLIVSPTGCHAKGDKIIMIDGSIKNIEDVVIGDCVMGADRTPKEVLRLYHGEDELFEIKPKKNRQPITVTSEHILHLSFTNEGKKYQKHGKIENIRVKDYLNKSKYYKHIAKLQYNNIPFDFNNEIDCNLSPYFIGLYLGDGSSHQAGVTNEDQECIDEVYKQADILNCYIRKDGIHYHISKEKGQRNPIFNEFDKIDIKFGNSKERIQCHERFIPECLFTTSIEYRYDLLAGLIDSDGSLSQSKTYYDFVFKSEKLRDGVSRLATTLGFVSTKTSKFINNIEYYRCNILGDIENIPVRIPRKISNKKSQINKHHCGFNIEPKGIDKYYGIEVQDSLYLHESGMIVHNSGKSLLCYLAVRYLIENNIVDKFLVVVPTTSLVEQLFQDFIDYSENNKWDVDEHVNRIYGFDGVDKNSDKPITITTWQSIFKLNKHWFSQYSGVVVDEAHLAAANSIKGIMEKMPDCKYKVGMTGTLNETKCHKLVLRGLFGDVYTTTTTKNLMDDGIVSNLDINAIIVNYDDEQRKAVSKLKYQDEIEHIVQNEKRNKFLIKLALSRKENTMLLFNRVEKHGIPLFEEIKRLAGDKKEVFIIHGKIKTSERERIRKYTEENDNIILVAGYQVFSTGINIKNLHNIIFGHPYKSKIKNLQSIGRALRLSKDNKATLYDIGDNYQWKKKVNITFKHFKERLDLYDSEKFDYKIIEVDA